MLISLYKNNKKDFKNKQKIKNLNFYLDLNDINAKFKAVQRKQGIYIGSLYRFLSYISFLVKLLDSILHSLSTLSLSAVSLALPYSF